MYKRCFYFPRGTCKFGNNCHNLHVDPKPALRSSSQSRHGESGSFSRSPPRPRLSDGVGSSRSRADAEGKERSGPPVALPLSSAGSVAFPPDAVVRGMAIAERLSGVVDGAHLVQESGTPGLESTGAQSAHLPRPSQHCSRRSPPRSPEPLRPRLQEAIGVAAAKASEMLETLFPSARGAPATSLTSRDQLERPASEETAEERVPT